MVEDPERRYAGLVEVLADRAGVSEPLRRGAFGADSLRVNGKIFAMLVRGRLVVKLPKERVDQLTADGVGTRFDANKGRPMKEWLCVERADTDWIEMASEALSFVSSRQ